MRRETSGEEQPRRLASPPEHSEQELVRPQEPTREARLEVLEAPRQRRVPGVQTGVSRCALPSVLADPDLADTHETTAERQARQRSGSSSRLAAAERRRRRPPCTRLVSRTPSRFPPQPCRSGFRPYRPLLPRPPWLALVRLCTSSRSPPRRGSGALRRTTQQRRDAAAVSFGFRRRRRDARGRRNGARGGRSRPGSRDEYGRPQVWKEGEHLEQADDDPRFALRHHDHAVRLAPPPFDAPVLRIPPAPHLGCHCRECAFN